MFSTAISIPPGILHSGSNVLAVELHQATASGADALLGATLDVTETPAVATAGSLMIDKVSAATASAFAIDLRNGTGGSLSLAGYTIPGPHPVRRAVSPETSRREHG